jgi:hypothetical protein
MPHEFDIIHTLEARSNFQLKSLKSDLQLDAESMHRAIQGSYLALQAGLDAKGIDYKLLKNALVPLTKKIETAFFFDWTRFDTSFWGHEVMDLLLPRLDRTGTRSILYGDWIGKSFSFAEAFEQSYGEADIETNFPNAWRASTVAFYYVNNLTPASKQVFEQAFSSHPAYIGALDLTYTSLMKSMISMMLIRAFIQHRNIVIDTHEDGFGPHHNEGYLPWHFKNFGLAVKSVESSLYQMFLSYKIERPVLDGEEDVAMSLNALTPSPVHIEDCDLDLDERRLAYLRQTHGSALSHAGFSDLSAQEIGEQIKRQFRGGYIYSMGRSKEDDTLKFNVVIENRGRSRVQCGLKYSPTESRISVITLF